MSLVPGDNSSRTAAQPDNIPNRIRPIKIDLRILFTYFSCYSLHILGVYTIRVLVCRPILDQGSSSTCAGVRLGIAKLVDQK